MKLQTSQLGEILYEEKDIIHFPSGLYGFEDYKRYLFVKGEEETIFSYLQCVDNQNITFILIDGYEVIKDYQLSVSKNELRDIQISEDNKTEIASFLITTVPEKLEDISVNLLGPIVINSKLRIGKQMISLNAEYTTKHKLLSLAEGLSVKVS